MKAKNKILFIILIFIFFSLFQPLVSAAAPNITYDGDYTVYTFLANGTFTPPAGVTNVSVLVVAGGGGGAAMTGGGGGAGGLIYNSSYAANGSNISVVVGNGGAGEVGSANPGYGSQGGNSTFGTLVAVGGGYGGTNAATNGGNGGSGGGCGHVSCTGGIKTNGQGNNGGSQATTAPYYGASGGGGAGTAGTGGTSGVGGGNGGNGLNYTINGSNVYYAGGGGGGSYSNGALGSGGLGGGGAGGAGNAIANTGGGGGGQKNNLANGGNGGSGIVIVRFLTPANETTYPIFSNYTDNSATLVDQGIGLFNVTLFNTNGTVLLEINNTNITATNLTANVYNASYNFTNSGVYIYRWHSWGNGTNPGYNKSSDLSYFVNATIDITPPNIYLISPLDYANLSSIVNFNCTVGDISGLRNSTLYGNWSGGWHANQTQPVSGLINFTNFTKTIANGIYTWNCYACDVLNNCGFSSSNKTFIVDTVPPSISITYPSNNSNFSYKNINVNYTVRDNNQVQACWYTNSSGAVNYSIANCTNLTTQIWFEGVNNITIYANDSSGNVNSSRVSFTVDTIAPSINIIYPQAIIYNTNVSSLNYTSNEAGNCWYTNNSGIWNSTLKSAGQNFSNLISIEGTNTWILYCNDSLGNLNFTNITFFKDTIPPRITIYTPYNSTSYADVTPLINVSSSETGAIWYNIDNGANTTLCTSCNISQSNFAYVSEGNRTIYIFANDSAGNVNFTSSSFTVNMNKNYYDFFDDDSSLANLNKVIWSKGNVSLAGNVNTGITFLSNSASVQGSWNGTYGKSGVILFSWDSTSGDSTNLSKINSYTLTANGPRYIWNADSAETRAVVNISGGATRKATCAYDTSAIKITLNTSISDYNLTLYILDWDTSARTETITITDNTGTYSANHFVNYNFNGGQHITFSVRGLNQVNITITYNSGANAVVSALFIDEIPVVNSGNFTSYSINTTNNITSVDNVTWTESNTDENNNITVKVSADNGQNWYSATKGQALGQTFTGANNSLIYRAFFNANVTKTISLSNLNISWSEKSSSQCSPTLNQDWIISDTQTCNGVQANTGTGKIIIATGGKLYLINGANVTAKKIEISTTGDRVFINSGSKFQMQ